MQPWLGSADRPAPSEGATQFDQDRRHQLNQLGNAG
jgi:hypothetical protein